MADGIGGPAGDPQVIRNAFGGAVLAAGYITGPWAWTDQQWALFGPGSRVQVVTRLADAGDVADMETGDLTPAQAAQWARDRRAAGYCRPTIYCQRSRIGEVRAATGDLALGADYDIWCADWTGEAHQVPGCAATQYQNTASYDLSAVYDAGWPHRTAPPGPRPGPVPKPAPEEEEDVPNLLRPKGTPTPIAVFAGQARIGFCPVFGASGSFPAATLSVNFHQGGAKPVTVTVAPDGTLPSLPIPPGVRGICVYRLDDSPHQVSYDVA